MRAGVQMRLQTSTRVDWFAILVGLGRKGLTTAHIALEVRVPKSTILGWKQGSEPNHADGERLIGLWLRLTESQRAQVPMTNAPEWLDR